MPRPLRQSGFSLIEVLVAIIIISIGVLGLVAMQGKAIQFTQDSAQRNTAVMLANDLIELIRSNRDAVLDASGQLKAGSNYFKAAGQSLPTTGVASCRTVAGCSPEQMATEHLATWFREVRNSLPVDDATLTAGYVIEESNAAVRIQIAWLSRNAECADDTPCDDAAEVDEANSREFYRISFEP